MGHLDDESLEGTRKDWCHWDRDLFIYICIYIYLFIYIDIYIYLFYDTHNWFGIHRWREARLAALSQITKNLLNIPCNQFGIEVFQIMGHLDDESLEGTREDWCDWDLFIYICIYIYFFLPSVLSSLRRWVSEWGFNGTLAQRWLCSAKKIWKVRWGWCYRYKN